MIPMILTYNNRTYELIKIYNDVVLYKDTETGARECFTKFQLGLVKEIVKPERGANKGGTSKYDNKKM